MRNGNCHKCGHEDVRVGKQGTVMIGQPKSLFGIESALLDDMRAIYDVYICLNCGNVELAISDPTVLKRVAQRWPRADSSHDAQG